MKLLRTVVWMTLETIRFSLSTRRVGFAIVVLAGLVLAGLTLAAQFVAPLALYPFV